MFLGAAVVMLFSLEFIVDKESPESTTWICLFASLMFGLFGGYFFVKLSKLGMFAVGAWLGYFISLILYAAFLYKIKSNPADLTLYVSNALIALIFGLVSVKLFDQIIIFATSLTGSFVAVYSLSILIG